MKQKQIIDQEKEPYPLKPFKVTYKDLYVWYIDSMYHLSAQEKLFVFDVLKRAYELGEANLLNEQQEQIKTKTT